MQNYVPMQLILVSQSTRVKEMNQLEFTHPTSNYTNQLVTEPKSYARLQGTELSREDYQKLNVEILE